ncbi:MAG: MerR family transcriptional regulator [Oscillospiraceae bacterium]
MLYTVGEMAKLLGVPASTLRYYDKEGLLPFVERSPGGMRMFQEKDYEWLQVIECLKKTGMPLKDIRTYIDMAMQGDGTIEQRLEMIYRQREAVRSQMAELQKTLDTLDFKCWYYETAKAAGTTSLPRDLPLEEVPEQYRAARITLRRLPTQDEGQS